MKHLKKIKGFPGYFVNIKGQVFSDKSGKLKELSQNIIWDYHHVHLYNKSGRKMKKVHRLVAEAFLKNPKKKAHVNHINGNKSDNRLGNLEWMTPSENHKHAFKKLGKKHNRPWKGKTGSAHNRSKPLIQKSEKVFKEWGSTREAALALGFCESGINRCAKGITESYKGYVWRRI